MATKKEQETVSTSRYTSSPSLDQPLSTSFHERTKFILIFSPFSGESFFLSFLSHIDMFSMFLFSLDHCIDINWMILVHKCNVRFLEPTILKAENVAVTERWYDRWYDFVCYVTYPLNANECVCIFKYYQSVFGTLCDTYAHSAPCICEHNFPLSLSSNLDRFRHINIEWCSKEEVSMRFCSSTPFFRFSGFVYSLRRSTQFFQFVVQCCVSTLVCMWVFPERYVYSSIFAWSTCINFFIVRK